MEGTKYSKPGSSSSKSWAMTVTRIPSWEEARPLGKLRGWASYLFLVGDVILVMLPICFIALGVAAITLHGKPVQNLEIGSRIVNNDFGVKVEAAIQLGPTLFPIVFAAISGRSMKMIARFLAERGAKLSTLELLMASQSVWGTVESQFLMRRLTFVGVNLLFLWALSPLGGQASLRLMEKSIRSDPTSTTFRYLSTGPGAAALALDDAYIGRMDRVTPLFAASLLGTGNYQRSEDLWGHVKLPRLDRFSGNASKDPEGWYSVPLANDLTTEDYVSLAGIPVVGRDLDQDASFNLETTQMAVECEPFVQKVTLGNNHTGLKELVQWPPRFSNPFTKTTFFMRTSEDTEDQISRLDAFFGFDNSSRTEASFTKRNITYASLVEYRYRNDPDDENRRRVNVANCSLEQTHTETAVECTKEKGCAAVRIRKSRTDSRPQGVTALEHPLIATMLRFMTLAFSDDPTDTEFVETGERASGSMVTEQFLFNSSTFPFVTQDNDPRGWVDLSLVPPHVFSKRLSLLLNTYYQLSLAPYAYMGRLPANNMSFYGPDTIPATDANVYLPSNLSITNTTFANWWYDFSDLTFNAELAFVGATANGTTSKPEKIYTCNFAWLAALFAAAGVIFAVGIASLALKRKTLGPEMFGFVTSMTYENPYVRIPEGGTMLDGMERARMLKDLRVHVGDVQGDEEIGHIAFAAGVPLRKLEKGRPYL